MASGNLRKRISMCIRRKFLGGGVLAIGFLLVIFFHGRSAGSGRRPPAGIRALARAFDVLPASCTRLWGPSLYDFRQIRNVQRCHIDAFFRDGGICRQNAPMRYVVAPSAAPHPVFPPCLAIRVFAR